MLYFFIWRIPIFYSGKSWKKKKKKKKKDCQSFLWLYSVHVYEQCSYVMKYFKGYNNKEIHRYKHVCMYSILFCILNRPISVKIWKGGVKMAVKIILSVTQILYDNLYFDYWLNDYLR